MSLDEWITVVACLSALWGIVVTFWAPQRLRTKIVCLSLLMVLAIAAVLLVRAQAKQRKKGELESQLAQTHLQDSVNQAQQKLLEVKEQLNKIEELARQPGVSNNELANALEAVNRLLAKNNASSSAFNVTAKTIPGEGAFPFGLRLTIEPTKIITLGQLSVNCSGPIGSLKWQPPTSARLFNVFQTPHDSYVIASNPSNSFDWSPGNSADVQIFSATKISCLVKHELLPKKS